MKNRLDAYLAGFEITMHREANVERLKSISPDQRDQAVDIGFFCRTRGKLVLHLQSPLLLEEGGRLGVTFLSPFRPRNPRPQAAGSFRIFL